MSIFESPVDPVGDAAPATIVAAPSLVDITSALANVGLLAIAGYALVVAVRQIQVNREQILVDREIEAINAYEAYHHLSIEHPELCTNFDHASCTPEQYSQYISYVMSMLLTIERIMTLFPNDPQWASAFDDDLQMHSSFLCSEKFLRHEPSLDRRVAEFIVETAKRHDWRYPFTTAASVSGTVE
jgi:hypothetical protein